VQRSREKLIDLTIETKRCIPPLGAWNDAFLEFNETLNALADYVPAVEASLENASAKPNAREVEESTDENVFRCDGDYWTVIFAGNRVRPRHTTGLKYIGFLTKHQKRAFSYLGIYLQTTRLQLTIPRPAEKVYALELVEEREHVGKSQNVGVHKDWEVTLDSLARIRNKIDDLRAEKDQAEEDNDLGGVERAEREIEDLTHALGMMTDNKGRPRRFDDIERKAKDAVKKAIRRALAKFRGPKSRCRHQDLWEHFDRFLSMREELLYAPDPDPLWRTS